jgi:hypothetical protein
MKTQIQKQSIIQHYMENQNASLREVEGHSILTYDNVKGFPGLMIIAPKAGKPYVHYYYRSEEMRNEQLNKYIERIQDEIKRKAEYKIERKQKANEAAELMKEGTILYSSWGYEQTNVDFYEVIERKGQTVTVQRIGSTIVEEWQNYTGKVVADRTNKIGQAFTKRINKYGTITLENYKSVSIWNGEPKYFSSNY